MPAMRRKLRSKDQEAFLNMLKWVGMCLLQVQTAERTLETAIEAVLDDPEADLMDQTAPQQKQTLGAFIRKLRRRVKVEPALKDKLYRFLEMRNKFVHNVREIEGWNLNTEEGRKIAAGFLSELIVAAMSISLLMATLITKYARQVSPDFQETDEQREFANALEEHFGLKAQVLLDARYRKGILG